jgi:hypothetical protein
MWMMMPMWLRPRRTIVVAPVGATGAAVVSQRRRRFCGLF